MPRSQVLGFRRAVRFATIAFALALGQGCAASIGDSCGSNGDCGTNRICDTSMPGGYCTRTPCVVNGCPDEAVCIEFDDGHGYCMKYCDTDGDCRGGDYRCVLNHGDHPYCGIPLSDAATEEPDAAKSDMAGSRSVASGFAG